MNLVGRNLLGGWKRRKEGGRMKHTSNCKKRKTVQGFSQLKEKKLKSYRREPERSHQEERARLERKRSQVQEITGK